MTDCQNVIPTPSISAFFRPREEADGKNRFSRGFGKSNRKRKGGSGLHRAGRRGAPCARRDGTRKQKGGFAWQTVGKILTKAERQGDARRPSGAVRRPIRGRFFPESAEIRIATTRQKKCFVTSSGNFSRHKIAPFWLTDVKNEAELQKRVSEKTRISLYLGIFESGTSQRKRVFPTTKTAKPAFRRQNDIRARRAFRSHTAP